MPTLNIAGKRVTVGDEFLSMTPDQQNASVEEIAKSIGIGGEQQNQSALQRATAPIANIIPDTAKYAREGLALAKEGLAEGRKPAEQMAAEAAQKGYSIPDYSLGGLGRAVSSVGKTVLGALEYATSPLSGAVNAIAGRPIEQVTGIPAEYTNFAASLAAPEAIPPAIAAARRAIAAGKAAAPDIAALKTSATSLYESPAIKQTSISPQSVEDFYATLPAQLEGSFGTTPDIAGNTFKTIDRYANRSKKGPPAPVTVDELRRQREVFGGIAADNLVTNPQETRAAKAVVNKIDDYLANLKQADVVSGDAQAASQAIKQANAEYSAAKSAETLDVKQFKAEMRAAAANSGLNVANTLRQRMVDIVTSPKLARQFSKPELSYMERIVYGTPAENLIRGVGNIAGGGGGLLTGAAGGVGYLVAGPAGAASVPAVGIGLRMLSNRMTVNNVRKLNDLVRSDSPTGRAMQNALRLWGNSVKPSQGGVTSARSALASQKIEELLRKSGIEMNSPIPAAAETESE